MTELKWQKYFVKPPSKIDFKILRNIEVGMEDITAEIGTALKKITEGISASDFQMKPKTPLHRKIAGEIFNLKFDMRMGANPIRVGVVDVVDAFPNIRAHLEKNVHFANEMVYANVTENYRAAPILKDMDNLFNILKNSFDNFITLVFASRIKDRENAFYHYEAIINDTILELNNIFGIDSGKIIMKTSGIDDISAHDKNGERIYGMDRIAQQVGAALSIVTMSIIKGDFSGPKPLIDGLEKLDPALDKIVISTAKEFRGENIVPLVQNFIKKVYVHLHTFYQVLLTGSFDSPQAALKTYKGIVDLIAVEFDKMFHVKFKRLILETSAVEEAA